MGSSLLEKSYCILPIPWTSTSHCFGLIFRSPSQGCTLHGKVHKNMNTTRIPNIMDAIKHARLTGDIGVGVQIVVEGISSDLDLKSPSLFKRW